MCRKYCSNLKTTLKDHSKLAKTLTPILDSSAYYKFGTCLKTAPLLISGSYLPLHA